MRFRLVSFFVLVVLFAVSGGGLALSASPTLLGPGTLIFGFLSALNGSTVIPALVVVGGLGTVWIILER